MEEKIATVWGFACQLEAIHRGQKGKIGLTSSQEDAWQAVQKERPVLKTFIWYFWQLSGALEDDMPSATNAIEAVNCLAGILEEFQGEDDRDFAFEILLQKLQHLHPFLKQAFLGLSDLSRGGKYFTRYDLKKLLDIAVKNLKDLVVLKPDMIAADIKKHIGAVEKRLEFVSAIFHFASRDQHVDQLNSSFNLLQDWVISAASVTFLYWVDKIDESVDATVSNLIEKFKPCNIELAELYLGALKALNQSQELDFHQKGLAVARFLGILLEDLLLPTDDGFEMLQHGLTFLVSFVVNPPRECAEEGKLISIQRNFCVNEAASLFCSLYVSNLKKDMARGSNSLLHDLIQNINQAKAEIRELQLEIAAIPWKNFPRTNVQGFLDFFIDDLKEKLKYYETCTIYQKHQVMTIQKSLKSLKPSLMGVFELQDESEELKDLRTQISRMAYLAEYFIDSCFLSDPTNYWHNVMCLSYVTEEIQLIKIELNKSRNTEKSVGILLPAQPQNTTTGDVMVGFTEEAEELISSLTGGLPQLNIVAIVGMPGQGKTTLAKNLYRDDRVRLRFQKYAWCCIAQAYQIENILISILKDVNPTLKRDDISKESHGDLAEMLYRCLKGKPYLVVLDDIWDIKGWEELKASFPDDENGSRIMFTSRIHTVALDAKPDCSLHELLPLSHEDSFELLRQQLSYKDGFPLNLLEIGKKIAKNCNGLPLAIVVIASLLAKADGNLAFWEQIVESLRSLVAREGCMEVLELSYKHLPNHLKPCFLYVAAFKEDEPILAKKLTRYWIAEGFIQKHENKSLEDVANDYLMDLVGRSLLSVAKRSSIFEIKKCVVHDLVREFCLEKGKEENFLLVPNISENHCLDKIHQSYRLFFHTQSQYWPSFEIDHAVATPIVRTLLFSDQQLEYPCTSLFFLRFKVLRVLDLVDINIESNIDAIMQLVHLRYLALQGVFRIPSSIVNLLRLEFLMLFVFGYEFPNAIWNMRSLQHLYLSNAGFEDMDDLIDESYQLDKLETFSSFHGYSELEEFKWLLRRIPNVRKLGIRLLFCVRLSDFLSKLESLEFRISVGLSASEFELPPTIRKLSMDSGILSASMMSAIGKLPNLEVLKLYGTNFEDQRWDVEDDEFLNLKYLKLHSSDIEQWNVSPDAFPKLQQLILKRCDDLTEVPIRFGMLSTIKVIKVSCCPQLTASVREIVEEQRDLGSAGLQITTDFPVEE